MFANGVQKRGPLLAITIKNQHFQTGGEFFELALPIVNQAGRGNNQGRPASLAISGGNIDNGLQGLAQSHVIGQNASQTIGVQGTKPIETEFLVGAQGHGYAVGQAEILTSRIFERPRHRP